MKRLTKLLSLLFIGIPVLAGCTTSSDSFTTSQQTNESSTNAQDKTYTISFFLDGGTSPSFVEHKTVSGLKTEDFFFDVTKEGYNFRGWTYNNELIIDEYGNVLKEIVLEDGMTFKALFSDTVKVTIETSKGFEASYLSIVTTGEYQYNTYVDLFITLKQGYEFDGWFNGDNLISNLPNFRLTIWDKDILVKAKISYASYNLQLQSYNSQQGLVIIKDDNNINQQYDNSYNMLVKHKDTATISVQTKQSIPFLGWFDKDDTLVSNKETYSFEMPNNDYVLYAKWDLFTISYSLGATRIINDNPTSYNSSSDFALSNPSRDTFSFGGWYDNSDLVGNPITSISGSILHKNLRLYAKWILDDEFDSVFKYSVGSDGICINGLYDTSVSSLTIPSNVKGYNVTKIKWSAFQNCFNIEELIIPEGVTEIGNDAFSGCHSMKTLTIPSSVQSIGQGALWACTALETLVTPFCGNSTTNYMGDTMEYLVRIPQGSGYQHCNLSSLKRITLIGNLSKIRGSNFRYCPNLEVVDIPGSVSIIEEHAFRYCNNLTELNYNGTVSDWNIIYKPSLWNDLSNISVIHCTDDDIVL